MNDAEKERARVVAWLRKRNMSLAAQCIKDGEHEEGT